MIDRKIIKRALCLLLAMTAMLLASCSGGENKDDGIEILCTIYPQYDWVKNIVGDAEGVTVELLVENGADIHGYQPSVDDMVRIKQSDAVILVGGESDGWVSEALVGAQSEAIVLLELEDMILYGVSDEYIAADHDHEHDHYHDNVLDEHVWLSVANARTSCRAICEWLCAKDPENATLYRANTDKYIMKLDALDELFETLSEKADTPVIFADRFPFVYLFEDYGISYFAAFEGCSTDAEADFGTVARLAEKLKANGGGYIAVTESSDEKIAQSVMGAAGIECKIARFDSMQSVTAKDVAEGYSYIGAMKANFSELDKILDER